MDATVVAVDSVEMNVPLNAQRKIEKLLDAARGYLTLEMPNHALRELQKIADQQGVEFECHQLEGEALRQKGEYETALDAFSRAFDLKPHELSVLFGLAWCYKRTGQLPKSIETMQLALESSPEEPIVPYNLSCYYALAGKKSEALTWLRQALKQERSLRKLISEETDFDGIRDDEEFKQLLRELSP